MFQCDNCGRRVYVLRSLFTLFRPFVECPACGTRDVTKLKSRDRLDAMHRNPLRHLLLLVGAPLYHCTFCRLQFRDWRKRESLQ